MGAILHDTGVAFRVWAPHADSVSVIGSFNDWSPTVHPMEREEHGHWFVNVPGARVGDEYKYRLTRGDQVLDRIDPRAREVTNSIGNGIIHDPAFDWGDDQFVVPPHNELVIYELHVGTFHRTEEDQPGGFLDAIKRFDHLRKLGVSAIEVMPICEFAGDWSWGYNPAHIFAIEQAYGGPDAFRQFVRAAHQAGFAVIMDVVYNHFGPSDLDLWQFDGWHENDKGGIYFYNDWRSTTPWGETRPDYGRGEVRQFIYDNAMMWLEDYRVDGLRYDMTAYIRRVNGIDESDIPEGWSLMQWINRDVRQRFPDRILIAEDLQGNPFLTRPVDQGGAGYTTQWDAEFVHPVRDVVEQPDDASRDLWRLQHALSHRYNDNVFERVVYSESHDEVANGKSRVPEEIDPGHADSKPARKRSAIAAALALTAPGIPMLMQGQEFLEDEHFDDADPLDWDRAKQFRGITRLYSDLIALRRNLAGVTSGLTGPHINIHHLNNGDKVLAYHRWKNGGPGDDVVVVLNLSHRLWENYQIGLPYSGTWQLRLNSAWTGYNKDFVEHPVDHLDAEDGPRDGLPATGTFMLPPYSVLIFSQDPQNAPPATEQQTERQ